MYDLSKKRRLYCSLVTSTAALVWGVLNLWVKLALLGEQDWKTLVIVFVAVIMVGVSKGKGEINFSKTFLFVFNKNT